MLLLMCLVYGSFGMVSASLAPLIAPILRDLDMTRTSMGLVLGSWQFVYLFVAIPAGAAIDRFGLKRALLIGICFVALSQIIRAGATHQYVLLAAVMVFGLGGPFISVGAPKLTSLWFPQKEVGSALGIYTVSPSVGSMIAVSTANSLLMPLYDNSWRLTLLSFAGIAVMAAIMWLLFARDPEAGQRGAPASGEKAPTIFASFGYLIKLPLVQIVLVMATGTFLFNHSFNNWLPEVLRTGGMTPSDAGYWASFPTFVAIFAALIIPRYTTDRWLTLVQVAVFGLWGVSAVLIAFTKGLPLYFGLFLLGMGRGGSTPLLMLNFLKSPKVGPKLMGAAGGLFFTAGEVGGVLGPTLTGIFSDATGDFRFGLLVLGGVAALLALLAFVLRAVTNSERREAAMAANTQS